MRNRCLILLTLPFLLFAVNGWGATYYVKNGGNDGANGLSDANAWASLSKVNSTSFSPGDSILFKRGSSWPGVLGPGNPGTSGGRITYGAYGTGSLPIIDGGWHTAAAAGVNVSYITFQYLDLRGSGIDGATIQIGPEADYFIVEYSNLGWNGVRALEDMEAGGISGLIIRYNTIASGATHDGGDGDCPIHGGEAYSGIRLHGNISNVQIHNNTLVDWGHDAISVSDQDPSHIVTNVQIFNNTIYMNRNIMIYGRCFDIGSPNPNNSGNKIFNNYCYSTRSTNQISMANLMFYNNVITDVHGGTSHDECLTTLPSYGLSTGMKIYNNVFANCGQNGLNMNNSWEYPAQTGNEVVNNVFYNNNLDGSYNAINIYSDSTTYGNTIKNNIIYKSGVSSPVTYHGSTMSVSTFNISDSNGDVIEGNIQVDPSFINPVYGDLVAGNFHLQAGSPAISGGINVGLTSDFAGNPIVGLPDIGAYEYGGSIPPPENTKTPGPPSNIQIN